MPGKLWIEPSRPSHTDYHPVIFSAILNRDDYPLATEPHIDQGVTAMVYVNPDEMCSGEIVLYRHRPTRLSRVPIGMKVELETLAQRGGFSGSQNAGWLCGIHQWGLLPPEFAMERNVSINDRNNYARMNRILYLQESYASD